MAAGACLWQGRIQQVLDLAPVEKQKTTKENLLYVDKN